MVFTLISSATYNWLVTTWPQNGKKIPNIVIPNSFFFFFSFFQIDFYFYFHFCFPTGIIRNQGCIKRDAWQAYECHGLDYEMLVIESMDSDTETRRLSPVALLGDGYLDLLNGPEDHGWCSGYTCQKRVSTFFSVVAMGTFSHYMYFVFLITCNSKMVCGIFFYRCSERI